MVKNRGALIPSALAFDRFGVITGCDGFDGLDVVGEEVPCVAALRDDLLVGLEDGDGEAVGAQISARADKSVRVIATAIETSVFRSQ